MNLGGATQRGSNWMLAPSVEDQVCRVTHQRNAVSGRSRARAGAQEQPRHRVVPLGAVRAVGMAQLAQRALQQLGGQAEGQTLLSAAA
jgi:hypothetical protein